MFKAIAEQEVIDPVGNTGLTLRVTLLGHTATYQEWWDYDGTTGEILTCSCGYRASRHDLDAGELKVDHVHGAMIHHGVDAALKVKISYPMQISYLNRVAVNGMAQAPSLRLLKRLGIHDTTTVKAVIAVRSKL